jgi:hypothetical protein
MLIPEFSVSNIDHHSFEPGKISGGKNPRSKNILIFTKSESKEAIKRIIQLLKATAYQ